MNARACLLLLNTTLFVALAASCSSPNHGTPNAAMQDFGESNADMTVDATTEPNDDLSTTPVAPSPYGAACGAQQACSNGLDCRSFSNGASGYSCTSTCTDATQCVASSPDVAPVGCMPSGTAKYCVLICGLAGQPDKCPGTMKCVKSPAASLGYCLNQ
jgi:hypothetical protein